MIVRIQSTVSISISPLVYCAVNRFAFCFINGFCDLTIRLSQCLFIKRIHCLHSNPAKILMQMAQINMRIIGFYIFLQQPHFEECYAAANPGINLFEIMPGVLSLLVIMFTS